MADENKTRSKTIDKTKKNIKMKRIFKVQKQFEDEGKKLLGEIPMIVSTYAKYS